MTNEPKTEKAPLHIEKVAGVDQDKFAERIANSVVDAVNKARVAAGKPPLKD